ncbi:MAG: glycosyltransferase [Armatimonadota bacterium]|nr:glycosyltransferase [Armatimonadota bacterium]
MSRHIVFFTDSSGIGGAEDVLAQIAAHAGQAQWSARAVLSDRATVTPLAERLRSAGVPVDRLPLSVQVSWRRRFLACAAYLARVRPDVLYVNRPSMGHGVPGIAAAWLTRVPRVILHEHFVPPLNGIGGSDQPMAVDASPRSDRRWWDGRGFKRTVPARIARWILVPSNATRELCLGHYAYPPERTRTVHFGIDVDRVTAAVTGTTELRREIGLSDDALVVACVARFTAEKGHAVLLEAMTAIVRQYPGAVLVLAGDGPLRMAIEAEAHRRALQERVRFLGTRDDVSRLLGASDVVVVPSLWESLPRVVLEAMAVGRPVVASAVGGIPEAVSDGETGLLVPAGDPGRLASAVTDLLRSPARRAEFGEAGRWRARTAFSLQRSLSEVYEFLRA